MGMIPMEYEGEYETIENVLTSTGRASSVTVNYSRLYRNKDAKIGILYFMFSTTAASSGHLPIGTLKENYFYGIRPYAPLINDTDTVPEGVILVNGTSTTVNVYHVQANKTYAAYIPIILA